MAPQTGIPPATTSSQTTPEYYYAVRILGPWGSMGIYEAQDIRPLALALLAHAERQEL